MKVLDVDLNAKAFYSGRYAGYEDAELMEVIDTEFFQPDETLFTRYAIVHRDREDIVHNGKLVHFQQVDQQLDLPPGTAKRLLNKVALRYGLKPTFEKENLVRYRRVVLLTKEAGQV